MILLIGYGNSLRGDDGLGIAVANVIANKELNGVVVQTTQQLHLEILEEAVRYQNIILVDASQQGEDVALRKIDSGNRSAMPSSHHLVPEMLVALGKRLYDKNVNLYLCSVKGDDFRMADRLTDGAKQKAQVAVGMICRLIEQLKMTKAGSYA